MLALQISISGTVVCTASAGADGATYFTLIERISDVQSQVEIEIGERCVHLMLDGTRQSERIQHMEWLDRYIKIGEEISIKVIETDEIDPPINVSWTDLDEVKRQKREAYEQLKKEFEGQ